MRASSRYVYQTCFVLGRLQPMEACACDRLFSYISGSCDKLGVILRALPCWGDWLPNNSLLHPQVIYPSACFSIFLNVHPTSNPAKLICKITFLFDHSFPLLSQHMEWAANQSSPPPCGAASSSTWSPLWLWNVVESTWKLMATVSLVRRLWM